MSRSLVGYESHSVLVVDNATATSRRLAEHLAEEAKVRVLGPVGNSREVRGMLREEQPAWVVIGMEPSPSAVLDLLAAIRGTRVECPVVVLTNHAEKALAEAYLQKGADVCVGKAQLDELVALVRTRRPPA